MKSLNYMQRSRKKLKNKLESERRIKEVKNKNKEKRDRKEKQLNAVQSQILLQKTNNFATISGQKRKTPEIPTFRLKEGVSGIKGMNSSRIGQLVDTGKFKPKKKKRK